MVVDVLKPGEGKKRERRSMSPLRRNPTCPYIKDLKMQYVFANC